jgi:GT2 family glycosyltransferase
VVTAEQIRAAARILDEADCSGRMMYDPWTDRIYTLPSGHALEPAIMKIGAITLSITPEYAARLSDRIAAQTRRPNYAVLVANSPRFRGFQHAAWDVVTTPGFNTSFSMGNNIAAAEMPADVTHLLLLNDDLIPNDTFIEELAAAAEIDAPIVGALLVHRDGKVNHAGGCELDPVRSISEHIGRGSPAAGWKGIATVPWVTFAAVLINRSLWDALGGLDESFVYGYEDHDFCMRALEVGAEIVCARDAVAIHEECGTRPRGGPRDAQNYTIFHGRWGGGAMATLLETYAGSYPDAEGLPK